MNDPYKCRNCGAPRSYISQYCPICESSGPHIPAGSKVTRIRPLKRKRNPDAPWWDDVKPDEITTVNKRKDTSNKEKKRDSFKEHKINNATDNDKEMRSLWATGPSTKPISGKTWRNISIAAIAALALIILAVNRGTILEQVNNVVKWGNELASYSPAAVTSTDTTNSSGNNIITDNKTAQVNTQSPTATENITAKLPEPAKDITKPVLLDKPATQPGDTTITITWKTDEKTTSQVNYGTDTSYQFPSIDDIRSSTSHSVYIKGLTPETKYHFQIISSDASGNILDSGDYTFKTESITNAAPYVESMAPDFTLKTLDGTEVSLSQFRGKKVILNFWASWCTPCKEELPHLQATWDKYKDSGDVMFLTVAGSQSEEDVIRSYMKDNGYSFIVCLDSGESTFNRYEIVSIPKTYFIDKGGTIRRLQQGMFTSPGEVEFMLTSY